MRGAPVWLRDIGDEEPCAGGGDRRRRGRVLGALPSHQARLDRRHADRALGADLRLDLARRRRHAHPQRRPQRRQAAGLRSEEHTSELQSLMRISYAVFCLKKKIKKIPTKKCTTKRITHTNTSESTKL